jgi:hypothetical protein
VKTSGQRRFIRGKAVTEVVLMIPDEQIADMSEAQIKMKVNAMLIPYLVEARKRARESRDRLKQADDRMTRDRLAEGHRDDEEI